MSVHSPIQCIYNHLIRPHSDIEQYVQRYSSERYIEELTNLLKQAIHNRNNLNSVPLKPKRSKEFITPKVTETTQQVESGVKIYGKPKIKLSNDIGCVIHCTDDSQSCIVGSHKVHKANNTCANGRQRIGITRVMQVKIKPIGNGKHIEKYKQKQPQKNMLKDMQRYNQNFTSSRKVGQISTAKRQSNKMNKSNQRNTSIQLHQDLKYGKNTMAQQQHEHSHGCSCSSDDEQVLQKLQSMYETIKNQHEQHKQRLKIYKVSSNYDYILTSSEQDQ